jgi:hypothetical protein
MTDVPQRQGPPGSSSDISYSNRQILSETTRPAQTSVHQQLADGGIHVAALWKSPRNRREAIQVSLRSYEGHPYVDARIFAMDASGRMRPTQRGIAVGVKTLPLFAKPVGDALRKATQLGLITAGSS